MQATSEILMRCPCGFGRKSYFAQCPQCRRWNTCLGALDRGVAASGAPEPEPLESCKGIALRRAHSGIPQLDDALNGGFVLGTSTIFYGEKNCGKTTLAVMAAFWVAVRARRRALYLSNEQGKLEIGEVVQRLGLGHEYFSFANPADLQTIVHSQLPSIVVIDSLQAFEDSNSRLRGHGRRKQAFVDGRDWGQKQGVPMIWVSQINAEGKISGGPFFAHQANVVLRMRQKQNSDVREIYVDKNRNGKAQFSVYMTMTEKGLV